MQYDIGASESGEPRVYFNCPACGVECEAPLAAAGTSARCHKCGAVSEIPGSVENSKEQSPPPISERGKPERERGRAWSPERDRSRPATTGDIDRLIEAIELQGQNTRDVDRRMIRSVAWGIVYAQALLLPVMFAAWLAIALWGPISLVIGFAALFYVFFLLGMAFRKAGD